MSTQVKNFLTTGDVAAITGFTIQKVRALCEQGKIPAVNTSAGKRPRWTIRRCDLDATLTPASVTKADSKKAAAVRRQAIDRDVPKVFG